VTAPAGRDNQPSIALNADGSVWIAFTRWAPEDPDDCAGVTDCVPSPEGVYYVTNKAGQWSEPQPLAPPESNAPSLEVRNGKIHLAYAAGNLCGELCGGSTAHYETDATGSWTDVELGETMSRAELELGSDGSAHVAYWTLQCDDVTFKCRPVIKFSRVAAANGVATNETAWEGEETAAWIFETSLALDSADTPHLVAVVTSEDADVAIYLTRTGGNWIEGEPPSADVLAAALDSNGSLHLLACCASYVTNLSGGYEEVELLSEGGLYGAAGDIAVDQQGRPHTMFVTSGRDGTLLWYAMGPA